jgi:SAM-dependent methyltransferase
MPESAIRKCDEVRLQFWRKWLGPDSPYPDARDERLKTGRPLPDWALSSLPAEGGRVRVLDLNAGPLSSLGNQAPEHQVDLIPVDPLAHAFDSLLEEHAYEPPVRTVFCSAEDILPAFGKASFDLIYCYNGLDFTRDPIAVYRQLLEAIKPGGRIITFHEANPPEGRASREWYRFFHYYKNGRVSLCQKRYRRDLADALPGADIQSSLKDSLLQLQIRPAKSPKPVSLSPCQRADDPLPELISMHIPKSGGTSFRSVLEELYGSTFRPMYAREEMDPGLAQKVKFNSQTRCLHGHFQADAFDGHFPEARKITWLRHPVDRVVSLYFQFHHNPESAFESAFNKRIFEEGWSLMDFARQPEVQRQVRWYFNAVPLDSFFFIGVVERYAESLRLFYHLLGKPTPEVSPGMNVNPKKRMGSAYDLSPAQRSGLESILAEETELYRLVEYRLREQLALAFGES